MTPRKQKAHFGKRLGWLLLIWLASVATLAAISLLVRIVMKTVGLHG